MALRNPFLRFNDMRVRESLNILAGKLQNY